MDQAQFWQLTDATHGLPDRADRLADALKLLPADEIIEFRLRYDDLINTANRVDLWGAAHLINGGCTEEGFVYFREGLIELGRSVFEAAIQDPESLVDVTKPGEPLEGTEGLSSSPIIAWTAATGRSEEDFYEEVDKADTRSDRGDVEEGERWNFADKAEARHRLPRLSEKFLPNEE